MHFHWSVHILCLEIWSNSQCNSHSDHFNGFFACRIQKVICHIEIYDESSWNELQEYDIQHLYQICLRTTTFHSLDDSMIENWCKHLYLLVFQCCYKCTIEHSYDWQMSFHTWTIFVISDIPHNNYFARRHTDYRFRLAVINYTISRTKYHGDLEALLEKFT